MGRRRGVMSESFKYELAKDLGFYDVVQREGWEGIRTKDAGNMVKRAIQIAEEHLAKQYTSSAPVSYGSAATGYSQPNYSAPNTPANYAQQGYGQGVYGSTQQAYSNYIPNNTAGTYNVNTSIPYQNQPSVPAMDQALAANQQAGQAGQRSYYS
ncbi:small, acid-soluble spore protein, alpha/beta type [Paenibacillus sp. WST5]|uniref:Small, acid-soluble spore protein, alpha/beta type n=1 Tax=Paenibacillus sedimenti TaxID=2770274 RepID=A0A926KV03_9BACL|nr:small, acid-soluble spore protein, alpha/beta type [Paenibacillus sedimenti]